MEIEWITNAEEIVSILAIDDPHLSDQVLRPCNCSKAEWVQWVERKTKQIPSHFKVLAVKEDGKIKAYALFVNGVDPPISRSIIIMYQTFFGMKDDEGRWLGNKVLEKAEIWGREIGAKNFVIQTAYPRINSRLLGFKADEGIPMIRKFK